MLSIKFDTADNYVSSNTKQKGGTEPDSELIRQHIRHRHNIASQEMQAAQARLDAICHKILAQNPTLVKNISKAIDDKDIFEFALDHEGIESAKRRGTQSNKTGQTKRTRRTTKSDGG